MQSTDTSTQISLSTATRLLGDAQDSPQHEICGLIASDADNIQSSYPIQNIAATPDTHFEMDPQQLIATTKLIRERGHKMIAIYHSHPKGNIEPSALDIQQHQYHDLLYIIISPGHDGVLVLGAYWIHKDQTVEPVVLCTQA